MASTYFFLHNSALLVTAYWGRTEIRESQLVRDAREADPSRHGARAHIIDLSALEGTTADPCTEVGVFYSLGGAYVQKYGLLPTVIIATQPHIYGEARVFQTLVGLSADELQVKVVGSWQEAARLLGIDLAGAEAEVHRRRNATPPPLAVVLARKAMPR